MAYRPAPSAVAQQQTPDYFGKMNETIDKKGVEERLRQATAFLTTNKPQKDERTYIQKALGEKFDPITSQSAAVETIRKYDPDLYKDIVRREERAETMEIAHQDKKRKLYERILPEMAEITAEVITMLENEEITEEEVDPLLLARVPILAQKYDSGGQYEIQKTLEDNIKKNPNSLKSLKEEYDSYKGKRTTEMVEEGDEKVTYELRDGERTGKVLGRGPRLGRTESDPKSLLTAKDKRHNEFISKEIAEETYKVIGGEFLESIEGLTAGELTVGVLGWATRSAAEIDSAFQTIVQSAAESGIEGFTDNVSLNPDDYDLGKYADHSASNQTNILKLALLFAAASGLGKGRALTDKDLKWALDAIGGNTGDISQIRSRYETNVKNFRTEMEIEIKFRGKDDPWYNTRGEKKIPKGYEGFWKLMSDEDKERVRKGG